MTSGGEFSLIDLFQEEVRADTAVLAQGLLELEVDAANPQRIEPLMRGAHSIKGAARIIGIDLAVQLAHVMEDVFVAAQEGRIRIAPTDIDVLLRGTDLLAELAGVTDPSATAWTASHADEIANLRQLLAVVAQGQPSPIASQAAAVTPQLPTGTKSTPLVDMAVAPAKSFVTAADAPSWQPIDIPTECIVAADDSPLMDLFREEVRSNCLLIQQGMLDLLKDAAETSSLEPLAAAGRAMRGAARIVGIVPAARLAEVLEEVFTAASAATAPVGMHVWQPLHHAVEILVELVASEPETVPEWIGRREADVDEVCRQLSFVQTDPQAVVESPTTQATTQSTDIARLRRNWLRHPLPPSRRQPWCASRPRV